MTAKIIPFPKPNQRKEIEVPVEIKPQIDFDLEPTCDRCIEYMEGASGQYCLAFSEMLMSVRQADGCLCFTEA